MLQKLRSFDIFGRPFSLDTLRGSGTNTTVIGGLLSIFAFVLFSAITYRVGIDFLDTTKPVVSVNRVKMKAPERFQLFDYEVLSSIGALHHKFLNQEEMKRYFTLRYQFVTTAKGADGQNQETVETVPTTLVANLKNPKMKELAIKSLNLTSGRDDINLLRLFGDAVIFPDINPEDIWISGSKLNLPYRRMRINIYPCSLSNPSDCAPVEDLAALAIGNFALTKVANYSNKRDPLGINADVDSSVFLGIGHTGLFTTYLKQNLIYDDDRDLLDERLTHTYLDVDKLESRTRTRLSGSIHCTVAQIDGGLCEPYVEISWKSSFEKMIIQRKYTTPFEAFSEIGGFCDLISYGIMTFYVYYSTKSYARFVRSQLVEGFVELDGMRQGEGAKRTPGEVNRMKAMLMKDKVPSHLDSDSDLGKMSFGEILNHQADLKKLVSLSFKSKILVDTFAEGPVFHTLANRMIVQKKREARKPSESGKTKNQKVVKNRKNPPKKIQNLSKKGILNPENHQFRGSSFKPHAKGEHYKNQQELGRSEKVHQEEPKRAKIFIDESERPQEINPPTKQQEPINKNKKQQEKPQNPVITSSKRSIVKFSTKPKKASGASRFGPIVLRKRTTKNSNFRKQ